MDQKELFEGEEKTGDLPMEGAGGAGGAAAKRKKGNIKILLGIGVLVIAGAYAASLFLFKEEEPVAPPPPVRMPIKKPPVMGVATGVKEVVEKKAKAAAKKEAPRPAEVKIAKRKEPAKAGGLVVTIGPYAAKYEMEAAQERLKGAGIRLTPREVKKKLTMNRVLVGTAKDREEVGRLLSELREKGYDPFSAPSNGAYKVYAVSNTSEEISSRNKADLEKLGYASVIEKKEATVKVFELVARAKNEKGAKELSAKLKRMGFRPEVGRQ